MIWHGVARSVSANFVLSGKRVAGRHQFEYLRTIKTLFYRSRTPCETFLAVTTVFVWRCKEVEFVCARMTPRSWFEVAIREPLEGFCKECIRRTIAPRGCVNKCLME